MRCCQRSSGMTFTTRRRFASESIRQERQTFAQRCAQDLVLAEWAGNHLVGDLLCRALLQALFASAFPDFDGFGPSESVELAAPRLACGPAARQERRNVGSERQSASTFRRELVPARALRALRALCPHQQRRCNLIRRMAEEAAPDVGGRSTRALSNTL